MHEGVHLRPMVEAAPTRDGSVEYVRVGASPESTRVPLERVKAVIEDEGTATEES